MISWFLDSRKHNFGIKKLLTRREMYQIIDSIIRNLSSYNNNYNDIITNNNRNNAQYINNWICWAIIKCKPSESRKFTGNVGSSDLNRNNHRWKKLSPYHSIYSTSFKHHNWKTWHYSNIQKSIIFCIWNKN